jgi:hypothetical protein
VYVVVVNYLDLICKQEEYSVCKFIIKRSYTTSTGMNGMIGVNGERKNSSQPTYILKQHMPDWLGNPWKISSQCS